MNDHTGPMFQRRTTSWCGQTCPGEPLGEAGSWPHFVDGGGIVRARRPHHKCALPTFDLGCNIWNMEADEIKRMYEWIQTRVVLGEGADKVTIVFDEPTARDFEDRGFGAEAISLTLESGWWAEMAADIVETPEYAEPGESPEQVLKYARDVVVEYVRKRLFT